MAYQNGSWPGHPQRYGPAQPATRGYPATQNHPGQGYPAYPGYPAHTQTWPDASWPTEPPAPGQPDYYVGPPPAPPQYGLRGAPVGVHIVAVMQYVTGVVLILAAGVIGVITFNDGRIGDTSVPESIRGAVTGMGLA